MTDWGGAVRLHHPTLHYMDYFYVRVMEMEKGWYCIVLL